MGPQSPCPRAKRLLGGNVNTHRRAAAVTTKPRALRRGPWAWSLGGQAQGRRAHDPHLFNTTAPAAGYRPTAHATSAMNQSRLRGEPMTGLGDGKAEPDPSRCGRTGGGHFQGPRPPPAWPARSTNPGKSRRFHDDPGPPPRCEKADPFVLRPLVFGPCRPTTPPAPPKFKFKARAGWSPKIKFWIEAGASSRAHEWVGTAQRDQACIESAPTSRQPSPKAGFENSNRRCRFAGVFPGHRFWPRPVLGPVLVGAGNIQALGCLPNGGLRSLDLHEWPLWPCGCRGFSAAYAGLAASNLDLAEPLGNAFCLLRVPA